MTWKAEKRAWRTAGPYGFAARSLFALLIALAIAGTLSGCSVPYRTALGWVDGEEMLEHGFLGPDSSIRVRVLRDNRPAAGHHLVLKTQPEPLLLAIGPGGMVDVPVRADLIEQNPWLEVHGDEGAVPFWNLKLGFSYTASLSQSFCEEGVVFASRDLSTLDSTASGPDVVYAEGGVPEADIESAAALLAKQRSELTRLFGRPPPPVGILLLASDPSQPFRFWGDEEGRPIWVLGPAERALDRSRIGIIVHEWTHVILHEQFELVSNTDARYLEDGLCELIAHRVHLSIRNDTQGSATESRYREFHAKTPPVQAFDLIELARRNSHEQLVSDFASLIEDLREKMCHRSRSSSLGYQVGLAWWLSQSGADPAHLEKVLAALKENGDLEAVLRTHQPGVDMNAVPRDEVSALLERHGGVRERSQDASL